MSEPTEEGVKDFLKNKLAMDEVFINEEMGPITVKRIFEKKNRNKDSNKTKNEAIVTFESKHVRDAVKAQGPNLANYREEAGMRLHVPDHLQKDFQSLMTLAFDLKKMNQDLRRNIKFDEDALNLFMDVQTTKDGSWKRIRPEQAKRAMASRPKIGGPDNIDDEEIRQLLGERGE